MTTTTFISEAADGSVYSEVVGDYAATREGTGSKGTLSIVAVGQDATACYEGFISFDTSSIGDTDTVSAATLRVWVTSDSSTTNFTLEARLYDWGTSVTTADFVAGSNLGSYTLLASKNTSALLGSGQFFTLDNVALAANINKTGATRIILVSDRHRIGTAPSGNEWLNIAPADVHAAELDVTYTAAGGTSHALAGSTAGASTATGSLTVAHTLAGSTAGASTVFGALTVSGAGGTVTIYGTSDGWVGSQSAVYATARSGGALGVNTADADGLTGQYTNYTVYELFFEFDTSTIPGTPTAVTLSLDGALDLTATDFTIEARLHDWGTSLTTADFVPGDSMASKTLLATFDTAGYVSGYNDFTESGSAFAGNLNLTGMTRIVLVSSRARLGTTPTTDERIWFSTVEASGTSTDPKLVVTYGAAGGVSHALAGSSAGTSTATGSLSVAHLLAGSTAGSSTASGVLPVAHPLAAVAAGTSTAAGAIGANRGVTGVAAGASFATGALVVAHSLAGTTAGTSQATGAFEGGWALLGITRGVSAATATMDVTRGLAGAATGTGTATGELGTTVALAGSAAATSGAVGALTLEGEPEPEPPAPPVVVGGGAPLYRRRWMGRPAPLLPLPAPVKARARLRVTYRWTARIISLSPPPVRPLATRAPRLGGRVSAVTFYTEHKVATRIETRNVKLAIGDPVAQNRYAWDRQDENDLLVALAALT